MLPQQPAIKVFSMASRRPLGASGAIGDSLSRKIDGRLEATRVGSRSRPSWKWLAILYRMSSSERRTRMNGRARLASSATGVSAWDRTSGWLSR